MTPADLRAVPIKTAYEQIPAARSKRRRDTSRSKIALAHREAKPAPTYQNGRSRDDRVPDFAALAGELRPQFRSVHKSELATAKEKLLALARARSFLILARRYKADFCDAAKQFGIKAGRLETRVIRLLFEVEPVDGWTSVGRWADRLAWLAERTTELSDVEAVDAAIKVGGLDDIGTLYRRARTAAKANLHPVPSPTFLDWAISVLDHYEPDDDPPEPDTIAVRIELVDRAGIPRLYARLPVETLVRSALAVMQRIVPRAE